MFEKSSVHRIGIEVIQRSPCRSLVREPRSEAVRARTIHSRRCAPRGSPLSPGSIASDHARKAMCRGCAGHDPLDVHVSIGGVEGQQPAWPELVKIDGQGLLSQEVRRDRVAGESIDDQQIHGGRRLSGQAQSAVPLHRVDLGRSIREIGEESTPSCDLDHGRIDLVEPPQLSRLGVGGEFPGTQADQAHELGWVGGVRAGLRTRRPSARLGGSRSALGGVQPVVA